ncbi:MAG: FkbM family methyltransferase [Candidatus Riflebacteria bacterium]|nr:FkbM family methyltransferase [Candidatus Riflebacteria bacterium]
MINDNTNDLKQMLSSYLLSFEKKAKKYIDYEKAFYGTGVTSQLYYSGLKSENIQVSAYINDFINNETFHGKPVYSLEKYKNNFFNKEQSLIFASSLEENTLNTINLKLKEYKLNYITADEYIFGLHKNEILEVFDWLSDDLSRITYFSMILRRTGLKPDFKSFDYTLSINDSYLALPEFRQVNEKQTIVDVGAYVGDSIEAMIWKRQGKFNKIYAFEPDSNNLKALRKRINRLSEEWGLDKSKFIIEACGVGEKSDEIKIAKNKTNSSDSSFKIIESNDKDSDMLKIVTIDDYFKDEKISILKADIESMEYNMLLGAEKVIKRDKPAISVCIYHNPSDMYRIAHLIKSYNPDYKLDIRQHYDSLSETVLYCY